MLGLIIGTLFHAVVTTLVLCVFAFILMDGNPANWGEGYRTDAVWVGLVFNGIGAAIFYAGNLHRNITNELRSLINEH